MQGVARIGIQSVLGSRIWIGLGPSLRWDDDYLIAMIEKWNYKALATRFQ